MDSSRFDCLTKSLAATTGRRTAAKLFAGSALGAIGLAHLGPEPAAAACTRNGDRCNRNGNDPDCCSGCCRNNKCRAKRRCN
jgi:hypothetical protein